MGANDITFTVSAKNRNFIEMFLQVQQAVEKGGVSLDDFGKRGQGAGMKLGDLAAMAGKVAAQTLGIGTALGSVFTVVSLVRDELEQFRRVRDQHLEGLKLVGSARQKALYGTGMTNADIAKNQTMVDRIIQASGQEHGELGWAAINAAGSARGEMTMQDAFEAALAATETTARAQDPEVTKAMAGSIMDIARTLPPEQRDFRKIAAGVLSGVNQSSRVDDPAAIAQNVVPVIATLMGTYGMGFKPATALAGTLSEVTSDERGRKSAQAALNEVVVTEREVKLHPYLKWDKEFQERFEKMKPDERIEFLRSDDDTAKELRAYLFGPQAKEEEIRDMALAKGYEGRFTSELKTRMAQQALMDPGHKLRAHETMVETAKRIPELTDESLLKTYDEYAGVNKDSTKLDKLMQADAKLKGTMAVIESHQEDMGAQGLVLQSIDKLADLHGDSALKKRVSGAKGLLKAGGDLDTQMKSLAEMMNERATQLIGRPEFLPQEEYRSFREWTDKNRPNMNRYSEADRAEAWQAYRLETMNDEDRSKLRAYYNQNQSLRQINPSIPNSPEPSSWEWLWGRQRAVGWEQDFENSEKLRQARPESTDSSQLRSDLRENTAALRELSAALAAAQATDTAMDISLEDHRGRAALRTSGYDNPMTALG